MNDDIEKDQKKQKKQKKQKQLADMVTASSLGMSLSLSQMQGIVNSDPKDLKLDQFKESINSVLKGNPLELSSDFLLRAYEQCFEVCTMELEMDIYEFTLNAIYKMVQEMYMKASEIIDKKVEPQIKKILSKRIHKDVSGLVIQKLYDCRKKFLQESVKDQKVKIQYISRMFGYMYRFWIPNQKARGLEITINEQQILIDTLDKVYFDICTKVCFKNAF